MMGRRRVLYATPTARLSESFPFIAVVDNAQSRYPDDVKVVR